MNAHFGDGNIRFARSFLRLAFDQHHKEEFILKVIFFTSYLLLTFKVVKRCPCLLVNVWCFRSSLPFCFKNVFVECLLSSPSCFTNVATLEPYCLLVLRLSSALDPFCLFVLQMQLVWIPITFLFYNYLMFQILFTFLFCKCTSSVSDLFRLFVLQVYVQCFRSFSSFCFASVHLVFHIFFVFLFCKCNYFESLSPCCFTTVWCFKSSLLSYFVIV